MTEHSAAYSEAKRTLMARWGPAAVAHADARDCQRRSSAGGGRRCPADPRLDGGTSHDRPHRWVVAVDLGALHAQGHGDARAGCQLPSVFAPQAIGSGEGGLSRHRVTRRVAGEKVGCRLHDEGERADGLAPGVGRTQCVGDCVAALCRRPISAECDAEAPQRAARGCRVRGRAHLRRRRSERERECRQGCQEAVQGASLIGGQRCCQTKPHTASVGPPTSGPLPAHFLDQAPACLTNWRYADGRHSASRRSQTGRPPLPTPMTRRRSKCA